MKKFILPAVLLFFIFVPSVQAVNINGNWVSREGGKVEAKQSGNTFTLTITDSRLSKYVGFVGLKGTITGNTFTGQQYYITDECPNLTGYVPAWGTISYEKIEVTGTGFFYDPDACVKGSNSEYSTTYTKTIMPSPTPAGIKQTSLPTKQEKSSEDGNPFSIVAFNPLEVWRNIQGLLDIPEGLNSLVQTAEFLSTLQDLEIQVPEPAGALDSEGKLWDFLPGYIPHESIYLGETMRVSKGTRISTGGVDQGSNKKLLNLEEGEVEVIKNKSGVSDSGYDGIKTPNATVLSVQTHYWVSFDKKTDQTTVAVYEGKVEVKTKDGKTTTVSPNGNKPEVVVIAQKLSVTKLALAGIILTAVTVGIIFFLKKNKKAPTFKKKVAKN